MDTHEIYIIDKIASDIGKKPEDVVEDDIITHFPIVPLPTNEIFQYDFASLFRAYQLKQEENDYNEFLYSKGSDVEFLTNEQFVRQYGGPPWDLANNLINEANLDYEFTFKPKIQRDETFVLELKNKISGKLVQFEDLSSGEKVIMSMVFAMYNTEVKTVFPEVLLLDEVDSTLHPSMSKQFLNVLTNVFVRDLAIEVILITHSPSTVALAPEEAIFIMSKRDPRISKATKDFALKTLTSGVPTLSVNYDSRRLVIVESNIDAKCYEKIYTILNAKLVNEAFLNFIPAGITTDGDCAQVKEVLTILRKSGNRLVFGVIDWDLKNSPNSELFILGNTSRYSLENFIFDPILIAIYLVREKIYSGDENRFNFLEFKTFTDYELQEHADKVISAIKKDHHESDGSSTEVKYINGSSIKIPDWYMKMRGHDLEDSLKNAFGPLGKFRKDYELKFEIINKVMEDLPELIPNDFIELFERIQLA